MTIKLVKGRVIEKYIVSYVDENKNTITHYCPTVRQMLKAKLDAMKKGYKTVALKQVESFGSSIVTTFEL